MIALTGLTGYLGIFDKGITMNCVTHHMKIEYPIAVKIFCLRSAGILDVSQKKNKVNDIAMIK